MVVVQDMFESPLWSVATYQLPGAGFAERAGSYVNFADRLQSFDWAIRPPAGVWIEGQLYWTMLGRRGLYNARAGADEVAKEIIAFSAAAGEIPLVGIDLRVNQLADGTTLQKSRDVRTEIIMTWNQPLIKILLLVGGLLTAAAYLVLLERWMAAWIQDRRGPNRVGIPLTNIKMFGLGQPLADGLKFIFKEEFTPSHVDKALFRLAPIVIMTAAVAIFAAIPFGSVLPPLGISGVQDPISLLVAPDLDVGMVYIFALSSIAVYGVILGGWASNNKYSFLGALRSSAQLISYEIPLGLGLLGVVLLCGTLRLDSIIAQQAHDRRVEYFRAAAGIFRVRHRRHGRSGAAAVRFAGGRAGTDRRLSHRIFRHEAAVVF